MAPINFFFDLSLLPDDSSNSNTSTSTCLLAAAAVRALSLSYSAVALDHSHRGLLNDSHSASGIASSLPRPPSSSLHRHRRSHPFQQYTHLTLSLDSATAAPIPSNSTHTSPSPSTPPPPAAFDHLCQATFDHLKIISIDFSHKLPFHLKLPMLKLVLQRGLYFEIAYSPLIADPTSRRQLIAQAKAAAVPSVKQKGIDKHVEFFKDTMGLDGTESRKMNLIADASMPLSSDDNLACSALPCSMELSDISIGNKYSHQSSGILDYAKACAECDSAFISCERVDWAPRNHDIPFESNVFPDEKGLDCYNDISVDSDTHRDTTEPLELPPCERDDEAPSGIAAQLDSNLCRDIMMPQQVMRDKVAPIDRKTISMECTLYNPETTSNDFLYDEGSNDTT
ncbi:hypothetical protein ABZP36_009460 [Zizania latifolia]